MGLSWLDSGPASQTLVHHWVSAGTRSEKSLKMNTSHQVVSLLCRSQIVHISNTRQRLTLSEKNISVNFILLLLVGRFGYQAEKSTELIK